MAVETQGKVPEIYYIHLYREIRQVYDRIIMEIYARPLTAAFISWVSTALSLLKVLTPVFQFLAAVIGVVAAAVSLLAKIKRGKKKRDEGRDQS